MGTNLVQFQSCSVWGCCERRPGFITPIRPHFWNFKREKFKWLNYSIQELWYKYSTLLLPIFFPKWNWEFQFHKVNVLIVSSAQCQIEIVIDKLFFPFWPGRIQQAGVAEQVVHSFIGERTKKSSQKIPFSWPIYYRAPPVFSILRRLSISYDFGVHLWSFTKTTQDNWKSLFS